MEWSGQQEFGAAATVPFVVEGAEAGQMKSHGPLTFLKVRIVLSLSLSFVFNHAMISNSNFSNFNCLQQ